MITTTLAMAMVLGAQQNWSNPHIYISRVAQIDNLDGGDFLGSNDADFFARVWVNGKERETRRVSEDDARPGWRVPLDTSTRINRIRLAVFDDDGGLEGRDDRADISPSRSKKDLTFTYDRYTGRIRGDVKGRLGQTIRSRGRGNGNLALIEFRIQKGGWDR